MTFADEISKNTNKIAQIIMQGNTPQTTLDRGEQYLIHFASISCYNYSLATRNSNNNNVNRNIIEHGK